MLASSGLVYSHLPVILQCLRFENAASRFSFSLLCKGTAGRILDYPHAGCVTRSEPIARSKNNLLPERFSQMTYPSRGELNRSNTTSAEDKEWIEESSSHYFTKVTFSSCEWCSLTPSYDLTFSFCEEYSLITSHDLYTFRPANSTSSMVLHSILRMIQAQSLLAASALLQ